MITQQVRAWNVLSDDVLDLLASMPREEFVPKEYCELAFADFPTPIAKGVTMLAPKEEGKILQALKVKPCDTVLEIGTGSGYLTALLASQAKQVTSVEISEEMLALAKENLCRQAIQNVTLELGNGINGWQVRAPYDVIVITGSMPEFNNEFLKQLKEGGRLFAIVGSAPAMKAILVKKISEDNIQQEVLYETVTPVLCDVVKKTEFEF